jgi:hypothetical protein
MTSWASHQPNSVDLCEKWCAPINRRRAAKIAPISQDTEHYYDRDLNFSNRSLYPSQFQNPLLLVMHLQILRLGKLWTQFGGNDERHR